MTWRRMQLFRNAWGELRKKREWARKYKQDKWEYIKNCNDERFGFDKKYEYRILGEWDQQAGNLGCYVWQDLWGAQKVYRDLPETHYDIGSTVGRFVMHLLSFQQKVCLIDIRPLDYEIPGVTFRQGDAKDLRNFPDASIESISSLCAIEHFGLGRYGDEIDPDGCFKALKEIQRVVKPGGKFYLSVPIGHERVEFNAHRIFSPKTIIDYLDEMKLIEFSTTGSTEGIIYNDSISKYDDIETHGLIFGLFEFEKC